MSKPGFRSALGGVVLAAACAIAPAAATSAAAPHLYYASVASIQSQILGPTPQIPTSSDQVPSSITASTCSGVGTPHNKLFNTFRCRATWAKGTALVWVRARAGGKFCASATGLASCPAAQPVAGDPRLCHNAPSPFADPNHCGLVSASAVIARAMPVMLGDPTWTVREQTCKGQNLTWSCQYATHGQFGTFYNGAITFKQAADGTWSGSIVVSGGGGPGSTCTVVPGTASGTISLWYQGAAPTCTN